ncbi:MAG: acyltransferase [Marinobacterium sp.]|nr:acyltransferase [Marinobacterium sp.]
MTVVAGPHRFAHIDAMRGLAAMLVVWLHVGDHMVRWWPQAFESTRFIYEATALVEFGRLGVLLFFAISGFIIPQSLNGEPAAGLKHFAIRRFFRLFPLYWLSIIPGYLLLRLYDMQMSTADIALNFTMLPRLLDYPMVLGLYWTLEVELLFYLLVAVLFALRLHRSLWLMLLLSLLLTLPRARLDEPTLAAWFECSIPQAALLLDYSFYLSVMFWGNCARLLYDHTGIWRQAEQRFWVALFIGLTLFIVYRPIRLLEMGWQASDHALLSYALPVLLSMGLFLLWSFYGRWAPSVLVWLGAISYSLYLLHPLVLYGVERLLALWLTLDGRLGVYQLTLVELYLINTLLTVALSALTWRLIERPAIAMGQRLSRSS